MSPAAKENAGAVLRLTERVGVPAVLLLLLGWSWLGQVKDDRSAAREERAAFVAAVKANTDAVRELAAEVARQRDAVSTLRADVLARGTR